MTPQAYPLSWPAGRVRRGGHRRGNFKYKSGKGYMEPVTIAIGIARLQDEVGKLGGHNLLISSNLQLGRNGLPLSNQRSPGDPGVCAFFSLDGKAVALACDTYSDVAQNFAALAGHIDAIRAQERYGVATAEESLRAFQSLPSNEPAPRTWRDIFGHDVTTLDALTMRYRDAVKIAADENALKELNIARDEARKELSS